MIFQSFIHTDQASTTTLSEIKRLHAVVGTADFFGIFAYATQSGVASFDLEMGGDFWVNTPSRWLFGLDYGRTQPQALRLMCDKLNAEVRVHDGVWVVGQKGFVPRRDFHAKMSILLNPATACTGLVIGSGNFSSNGLRRSIEAGASVYVDDAAGYEVCLKTSVDAAEALWQGAVPVTDLLDQYEKNWTALFPVPVEDGLAVPPQQPGAATAFWIEAGYVTKNRGPDRPGNQIDLPRGMGRYFGFDYPNELPPNTFIGVINFRTPIGDPASNNLRLGNNMMEKVSLPIPETHGFDLYDGKVLIFQKDEDGFFLIALEQDDFDRAFSMRVSEVRVMGSGRRYGRID